jgi:hypothetical protein
MNLQAELDQAVRAEKLLNDDTLTQAFTDVRQAIIDKWEATPLRDKDGAHELKLMLKLLSDVRANLEQAVSNGKLAAEELKRINRRDLSPASWLATLTR